MFDKDPHAGSSLLERLRTARNAIAILCKRVTKEAVLKDNACLEMINYVR